MDRIIAATVASAVAATAVASVTAQTVGNGVISGAINGPNGPLGAVTVQVVDATGTIVGNAVTTAAGTFSVGGLPAGTFLVRVMAANGNLIGTSTAMLAADAMTAIVAVQATEAPWRPARRRRRRRLLLPPRAAARCPP